ncbi:DinB family protein [Chitinophaga nivalis]|uniref:DinB family protein n=1 Tax=Chitinophaga nivalis TaxID=2991709 RepID=A0ABT3IMJ5_9BACT|nr:DinB family protein [Chitinophaga nivalis]MCW3465111.1 DinB family protein [Chitinophaga nivalis]MCW3485197.1 DinB family protein [Chitinophaga nivalis]
MSATIQALLNEMEEESITTRKMLQRVPQDRYDWQPHPKSMTILRLATHVAELPGWITMGLTTSELDFAKYDYKPEPLKDNEALLAFFETTLQTAQQQLAQAQENQLDEPWVLRNGDIIIRNYTKASVIRMIYSQIVHHRAQLGVYLRLLDIPIPGSYGPSADEQ